MSCSRMVCLVVLTALALLACERGHYETRDRAVPDESAGGEGSAEADAGVDADASAEPEADAGADADAGSDAEPDAGTGHAPEAGHAPEEGTQRAGAEAGPVTQVTVRSATGPITLWLARRAIGFQADRIDRCYRVLLGTNPDAAGSIRAVLTVEPSSTIGAELETMVPELDRAIPCIDAALEDTQLPAATDGRPSHITLEVSLAPHR